MSVLLGTAEQIAVINKTISIANTIGNSVILSQYAGICWNGDVITND